MAFLRRHWPVLLVVLFPILPLWRAVFLGEAIGPFDQIRQMAPWNAPAPERPFDVLQADAALQFYPWRDMVFEAWGKGQLPLWNPYQLAGTPLLGNSQSAGFYPPHIAMGVLHVPTPLTMTLLAWFHLALAGLGVMALARRLGATREGGAIGGVLFSGSAFMLAWTALPSVVSTCAWIPWVLAGVYGLFEDKRHGESVDPSRTDSSILQHFRTASGLAFCTGMMLLAGHLQFAFYGLLAAGFVLACHFVGSFLDKSNKSHTSYSLSRLTLGLLSLGIGVGLAAPQLLPVLENSKYSHRRNTPNEEGYKAYVAGAIAPFELVGLVYPTAVGLPFEFAPEDKPLSQYWPALVKQGANFAEGAIGIGPLALFGLLMFPWRSASKRLWAPMAMLGGIAFLMALGTILNKPFYFWFPGWSSTGSPGRIMVLFVMGACVLTSIAVTKLIADPEPSAKRYCISFVMIGLAMVVSFFLVGSISSALQPRFPGMDPETISRIATSDRSTILSGVWIPALFLGLILLYVKSPKSRIVMPLVALILAVSVFSDRLTNGIVPTGSPLSPNTQPLTPDTPSDRIAAINDPWELIVAAPATLPPNTASILRIPDLAGYDSLLNRDTQLMLADINGQNSAPPANGNIQYIKPTADPGKLADAGVSIVYSRRPVFEGLTPEPMENGLLRYRLPTQGRAYIEGQSATKPNAPPVLVDGYDRQTIACRGAGTLVVKDRLMPGWKAFLNGKSVRWSEKSPPWKTPDGREVRLWREVEVPAGENKVEFRYDPPGLSRGLLIFLPCLLLAVAGLLVGRKRASSEPLQDETK